jgi:Uma2 family endonuclease
MFNCMPMAFTWDEICSKKELRDLPYKIEQDKYGRIVMSPVKLGHSEYQGRIIALLIKLLPEWRVLPEFPVETDEGVRVPDLGAFAAERFSPDWPGAACPIAPDICIEVLSSSNTDAEMDEKRGLYAARGCREFWTCSEKGLIRFQRPDGTALPRSELCPEFPSEVSR